MFLSLISLAVMLQGQPADPPTFAQVVIQDFDKWDADHDGALTAVEIDRAALDSQYHGADAAALAALHGWLAAAKDDAPKLDKQWFLTYKPAPVKIEKGTPAAEAKAIRKVYAKSPDSLESSFNGGLRRLKRTHATDLFEGDGPALTDIRQGALGDCYMLAPLGAVVHRNPDELKKMIQPDGSGFLIRFGDGKEVHVGAPTDTELAMGGSATSQGLWIRLMEKAYGSRRLADGQVGISRDSMNGGSPGTAGAAFTGHKFTSVRLIGDFTKEVTDETLKPTLDRLRTELPKALQDHRLILASTPSRGMPVSINGNHAYAVFDYEGSTDRIILWNPHGNDFKPKGPEGVQFGYARKDGVFSMPLTMFAKAFGRVMFENRP